MKKLFLLLLVLPFVLSSCSDDEDEKVPQTGENLIGEWVLVNEKGYEIEDGKKDTWNESYKVSDEVFVIKIDKNGRYSLYEKLDENDDEVYVRSGVWSYEKGKLVMTYENGREQIHIVTRLTATDLTLVTTDKEEDYESSTTTSFKKKK
ncbi:lipocalin-like domain-containing protein [Viscerimonas tarda]